MEYKQQFGENLSVIVDLTVEDSARLKVLYGSNEGFHAIDLDSASLYDIYTPQNRFQGVVPHCIVILPNTNGMNLVYISFSDTRYFGFKCLIWLIKLLLYNNEGVFINTVVF